MEKAITIKTIDTRNKKDGGTYWIITGTDNYKYSVWDSDIYDLVKAGKSYLFEVLQKDGFNNIKGFLGAAAVEKVVNEPKPAVKAGYAPQNQVPMYVSYVKDLIVAGKSPEEALELIRSAIDAFS